MPSLSWNKFAQLPALSTNALILLVAAFIVATGNQTFFSLVFRLYSWRDGSGAMVVALAALLFLIIALMLALFAWGRAAKPVLAATVLVCALTAAFMYSYGVVINDEMIRNVLRTNVAETSDLISLRLLATLFMMGVLPTLLQAAVPLQARLWRDERDGDVGADGDAEHGARVAVEAAWDVDGELWAVGGIERCYPGGGRAVEGACESGAEEGVDPRGVGKRSDGRGTTGADLAPRVA